MILDDQGRGGGIEMAQVESSHVERYRPSRETKGSSVADILERVLDKGIVITGDIKIFLTDVELLTIQIRLIICSVERAEEIGLDWWKTNPAFSSAARQGLQAGAKEQEPEAEEAEAPVPGKA
ncbi:MAG TPA: gas vesicle protein [Vulgatibacter sp.]